MAFRMRCGCSQNVRKYRGEGGERTVLYGKGNESAAGDREVFFRNLREIAGESFYERKGEEDRARRDLCRYGGNARAQLHCLLGNEQRHHHRVHFLR